MKLPEFQPDECGLRLPLREFPPLPVHGRASDARKVRVCIAAYEVSGPNPCGGVGTHYTTLAEALARAGNEVTILYTPGTQCPVGTADEWAAHFAGKGIRFVPLPDPPVPVLASQRAQAEAYAAYLWLREHDGAFDVVHFADGRGVGFYAALARRMGAALRGTLLCVGLHGGLEWAQECSRVHVRRPTALEQLFFERRAVELADCVHSPGQYMANWALRHGWRLPERVFVQPYILPYSARGGGAAAERRPVSELVFFGRLEPRKGMEPFLDAMDLLAAQGSAAFSVTFLGRPFWMPGVNCLSYVQKRAATWPFPCRLLTDLDQPEALEYLRGEGRLAVMPSLADNYPNAVLECIGAGVPFIASDRGGIPEIVAPEDRPDVLVAPRGDALAERLRRALSEGVRPARSAVDHEANERAWVAWHEEAAAWIAGTDGRPAEDAAHKLPGVTACAVEGSDLEGQTHRADEVLTVPPLRDGLGEEFSSAVRRAKGDYVLLLAPGDVLKPDALAELLRVAVRTGADVVTCAAEDVDPEGRPIAVRLALGPCLAAGVLGNCFGGPTMLVRREAFERAGGLAADYAPVAAEREFIVRALLMGMKLEAVPQVLVTSTAPEPTPTEAYGADVRAVRAMKAALSQWAGDLLLFPQGLLEMLAQGRAAQQRLDEKCAGLTRERNEWRGEAARYKRGLELVMNKPPLRAYRALKAMLGRFAGKRREDKESDR